MQFSTRLAVQVAEEAARAAGDLQLQALRHGSAVLADTAHDTKLEIDLVCERRISEIIQGHFPEHFVLGEESAPEHVDAEYVWIVDPLDGTCNFERGITRFCSSIALRRGEDLIAAAVYDPNLKEMFSAGAGAGTTLNGRKVHVSNISDLSRAVLVCGFMKDEATIRLGMEYMEKVIYRAKKVRVRGSAALDLAHIACGRVDGYFEYGVKIWDIAAGILLVEEAGGWVEAKPMDSPHTYAARVTNGKFEIPELAY